MNKCGTLYRTCSISTVSVYAHCVAVQFRFEFGWQQGSDRETLFKKAGFVVLTLNPSIRRPNCVIYRGFRVSLGYTMSSRIVRDI